MGEYAIRKSDGQSIKIGTCEQMYYLRADQVDKISPQPGNVNPRRKDYAESIRFRFPFPDEDAIPPGDFNEYDRGLAVFGIDPPADIEHYSVQFTNGKGLVTSLPCPEGKAGKKSTHPIHYNGYSGKTKIHSQRLVDGKLALICMCGSCGALWRVPTLEDAQPILDYCLTEAKAKDSKFWYAVADRIRTGYTQPNYWTNQKPDTAPKGWEAVTA